VPRIVRIGRSLYILIPREIAEELKLREGDALTVRVEDGRLVYERIAPEGSVWALVPVGTTAPCVGTISTRVVPCQA